MIFTGASASMRGRPRFAAFSSAKMGLRAIAQSMAREFGPAGIHVAHVVIDGGISGEKLLSRMPQRAEQVGPDGLLDIEAIAETYWHIHRQPRSAWTHEVDLRPFKESF
jgi:NAD(P)-dependent dehydrogenase (short-subunit alcohol dehydrogenase family)